MHSGTVAHESDVDRNQSRTSRLASTFAVRYSKNCGDKDHARFDILVVPMQERQRLTLKSLGTLSLQFSWEVHQRGYVLASMPQVVPTKI